MLTGNTEQLGPIISNAAFHYRQNINNMLSSSHVLSHHTDHKKKTVMSNSLKCVSKLDLTEQKYGGLAERAKWNSHICKRRVFHHRAAHLYANFGGLDPSNNMSRCLDFWEELQATIGNKNSLSMGTFLPWSNFSQTIKIIVDIIAKKISLGDVSWALENKKIHWVYVYM